MHNFLISKKFEQLVSDPCVYVKNENGTVIVLIWVDDIIISSDPTSLLESVKNDLHSRFKMKDLGKLSWFLGIRFTFEANAITMDQCRYVKKILRRFKMNDCKPRVTPSELSTNKKGNVEDEELVDKKLYQEIVGSLIYIMICTRPDLSFTVTKLSQYMSKPTSVHLCMA